MGLSPQRGSSLAGGKVGGRPSESLVSLFTQQGARSGRVRTLNVGAKHVGRKGDIRALQFTRADLGHVVSFH